MITNQEIKLIKSLDRKSSRIENGFFVVEGIKNIEELLKSDYIIFKLFAVGTVFSNHDKYVSISQKELDRISHLKTPNQALALVCLPNTAFKRIELDPTKSTLVLDGINDPGNLGTIIRTADWFGIQQIYCSEFSVDAFSPKVVMSSMGSLFRVKIGYGSLIEFIRKSPLKSYAAVFDGVAIEKQIFDNEAIVVMGSESHGISKEVLEICKHKITISGGKKTESLNLAVATGIICHQFFSKTTPNI